MGSRASVEGRIEAGEVAAAGRSRRTERSRRLEENAMLQRHCYSGKTIGGGISYCAGAWTRLKRVQSGRKVSGSWGEEM